MCLRSIRQLSVPARASNHTWSVLTSTDPVPLGGQNCLYHWLTRGRAGKSDPSASSHRCNCGNKHGNRWVRIRFGVPDRCSRCLILMAKRTTAQCHRSLRRRLWQTTGSMVFQVFPHRPPCLRRHLHALRRLYSLHFDAAIIVIVILTLPLYRLLLHSEHQREYLDCWSAWPLRWNSQYSPTPCPSFSLLQQTLPLLQTFE